MQASSQHRCHGNLPEVSEGFAGCQFSGLTQSKQLAIYHWTPPDASTQVYASCSLSFGMSRETVVLSPSGPGTEDRSTEFLSQMTSLAETSPRRSTSPYVIGSLIRGLFWLKRSVQNCVVPGGYIVQAEGSLPSRTVVLKLFGVITPRQCYDRSSLPLIPFPFSYVKLKEKILGCLVLVHFICKKIILL